MALGGEALTVTTFEAQLTGHSAAATTANLFFDAFNAHGLALKTENNTCHTANAQFTATEAKLNAGHDNDVTAERFDAHTEKLTTSVKAAATTRAGMFGRPSQTSAKQTSTVSFTPRGA